MSPNRGPSTLRLLIAGLTLAATACRIEPMPEDAGAAAPPPEAEYTLGTENTHARWSATIARRC